MSHLNFLSIPLLITCPVSINPASDLSSFTLTLPLVTATMSLVHLPTELLLMIESHLHARRDRNAFTRICPRFNLIFEDKLYQGCTPQIRDWIILWAAQKGLDGTIRKCLRAGAKIIRRDRFRSHLKDRDAPDALNVIPRNPKPHPLTIAAEAGSLSCVSLLLAKGVNPNLLDEHYETPMRQAAGNGHVDIVQLLLDSDPDAFTGAYKLRRPLKMMIEISLSKTRHRSSCTRGLWHCEEGVVRYALEQGADVNDEDPQFAFRFAPDLRPEDYALRPRIKLVQSYKMGVAIGGVLTPGWSTPTPNTLHAAIIGGETSLIELILDQGFDIAAHSGPVLRYAVYRRDAAVISKLMKLGVTVTATMLYDAICERDDMFCKEFIESTIKRIREELRLRT
ncbi:unnamed protein product [Penicillium nalgiovense]|nr:unnamed protein product [Penicillium nalgiovense]CAG8111053.1 unnamed protein product [Penicillium nalgiovense]CAG8122347.1 unnamed protein product [Penicillium nalgiovense]CAG8255751.1 unnamed protein product [Penicillium nalgiovense]